MVFQSILWFNRDLENIQDNEPDFFKDLNLDQMVDEISKSYKDLNIKEYFYENLNDEETIKYRQDVFKDLENKAISSIVEGFSSDMKNVARALSGTERLYEYQKEGWILEAATRYCGGVLAMKSNLGNAPLGSTALISLREYIENYIESQDFNVLRNDVENVRKSISEISYEMTIDLGKITVKRDRGKSDYNTEIYETFKKFRERNSKMDEKPISGNLDLNHVEAAVLVLLSRLFPNQFGGLLDFDKKHHDFMDPILQRLYHEIQFYLAYRQYIASIKNQGMTFCIPEITTKKEIFCKGGFDIVLAKKLSRNNSGVITNDFFLANKERIIVVTGPNNGGKTTFARFFGQVHFLASLGLPIPGINARIFLFDKIFTHFPRSEDLENLLGKLEEDITRIKRITDSCTTRSVVIINEMLSSTTVRDATFIGTRIIERMGDIGSICVYVTFLDQLSRLEGCVSMVAQVDPVEPERRTFKISRMESDGMAYAAAISKKYHVTFEDLSRRIKE